MKVHCFQDCPKLCISKPFSLVDQKALRLIFAPWAGCGPPTRVTGDSQGSAPAQGRAAGRRQGARRSAQLQRPSTGGVTPSYGGGVEVRERPAVTRPLRHPRTPGGPLNWKMMVLILIILCAVSIFGGRSCSPSSGGSSLCSTRRKNSRSITQQVGQAQLPPSARSCLLELRDPPRRPPASSGTVLDGDAVPGRRR